MSDLEIVWDVPGILLEDAAVARAVQEALRLGGREGIALAVTFVSDAALAGMHGDHLDDPSPTDVMAFDLGEEGVGPAGELYVSADRAVDEAERRGVPVERELSLYVVHGVLHLCGFDDRSEEDRRCMRRAEGDVLAAIGFDVEPPPRASQP